MNPRPAGQNHRQQRQESPVPGCVEDHARHQKHAVLPGPAEQAVQHVHERKEREEKEIENATEQILEDNGIAPTRRGSTDMMALWKAKKKNP